MNADTKVINIELEGIEKEVKKASELMEMLQAAKALADDLAAQISNIELKIKD